MRRFPVLAAAVMFAATSCGSSDSPPESQPTTVSRLQAMLDAAVADNTLVHGAALRVDSPALDWQGAAGFADVRAGIAMTPAHPVRVASNAKTYIAVAILRLAEEGRLDLDDPIERHLAQEHLELLRGDGYDTASITVRHLLTHTSGLFDHSAGDVYTEKIMANPSYRWTRTEQLAMAIEYGEPHGPPGAFFSYCDTGYILLGEVVERANGRPMATSVRELIGYEALGLDSTWWELMEAVPSGTEDRAHQFLDEVDVTDYQPYYDLYGGGGVVATVGDLARFWRGLFSGAVYRHPDTLPVMLTTVNGAAPIPDADEGAVPPGAYRMGLWEVEVAGHRAYRHTGFWGTSATWVPDLDLVVALTVNQHDAKQLLDRIPEGVVRLVAELP